jgi:hypothetical protein
VEDVRAGLDEQFPTIYDERGESAAQPIEQSDRCSGV